MDIQEDGKITNNSKEEKAESTKSTIHSDSLNQKIMDSPAWKDMESIHIRVKDIVKPIYSALSIPGIINESLALFGKPSKQLMDEMQKLRDGIKEAYTIPKIIDYSEWFEPLRKMAAQLSEIIKNIKIPSISEERKQELLEIHMLWGMYGWTINPCVEFKTLFNSAPSDKKDADIIALKACSKKEMEKLFGIIMRTKRVKKTDFEEAVFDYKHRQYKSCALVLFSLVDATLIRLQKKSDLNGKGRKVGLKAVKKVQRRIEKDVNKELFFTVMFCTNISACLEKMFESGNDFKQQPEVINRNFLDHGMLTRRVSRKDCIQLFLLYYNMLELLDKIY